MPFSVQKMIVSQVNAVNKTTLLKIEKDNFGHRSIKIEWNREGFLKTLYPDPFGKQLSPFIKMFATHKFTLQMNQYIACFEPL